MTRKIFLVALFLLFNVYANGWAQDIGSLISPGELSSPHAKYDGIKNCTKCHELGEGITDSKCLECHDKLAARISNKQGYHANIKDPCIKCHSDHKGRGYKMVSLDKDKFDHEPTGYSLKDKHADVKCIKCHKKEGVYTGLAKECISCHEDKHKGQLDKDCGRCHNFKGWKDIEKFKHDTDSKYQLKGKHMDVKCAKCHPKNKFKIEKYEECITCHKDPHKGKPICADCHTTDGWKKVKIDHSKTKYPLTNKHEEVACEKCHKNKQLKDIPFETCDGSFCHKDPHKNQFKDKKCDACHNTKGWKPSLFDHASQEYKGYKLDGKHVDTKCEKCHVQGRYKPLNSKTCDTADCHKDEHKGQFKEKACDSCHNTKGWKPSLFDHASQEYKGFKLDGKHVDTKCEKCHVQDRYKPLNSKTCDTSDCHKNPHKGQFKDKACDSCHTTKSWKETTYDHSAQYSAFKLSGKHEKAKCDKCHAEGKYSKTPKECIGCHEKEDVHKNELGKLCEKCHDAEDWKKPTFNHNLNSEYPLIGKHKDTKCDKCHKEKKYKTKDQRCIDCHKDIHKGEFDQDCSKCHTPFDWQPKTFDHKKQARFELKGIHNDLLCTNCHKVKGEYKGVNRNCSKCHTDPHLNQFGSSGCEQCHTQNSWNPTLFNHSRTGYPLVGQHRQAECRSCHADRVYRRTSTACYNCHVNRYNSALNHLANGYSHECRDCHIMTFTSWAFNHSKVSGSASCATCHLNNIPASHAAKGFGTSCENCHRYPTWIFAHPTGGTGCGNSGCHLTYSDRPRTPRHATNNWVACEVCHKYPTWTFVHQVGGTGCSTCHLGLEVGKHRNNYGTTCENCHKYPSWTFSHTTLTSSCNTCHSAKYPAAHQTYNNRFGTTCESCHRYPSWPTTTFNHTFSSFPTSHEGYSRCSDCHPSQNYGNKGGCIECHRAVGEKVHETNQNSGCLSCHPTGKD